MQMQLANQYYDKSKYFFTNTGNKVSQRSKIPGNANIFPMGKVIIRSSCIIRGDLGKIKIGKYSIIQEEVIIHPPCFQRKGQMTFKQIEIGANVHLQRGSIIQAEKIGNNVRIGRNSIIQSRCQISDNCLILMDSILAPDTVVPSFTVYGGKPARFMGQLTQAMPFIMQDFTMDYYLKFKPSNTSKSSIGGGVSLRSSTVSTQSNTSTSTDAAHSARGQNNQ